MSANEKLEIAGKILSEHGYDSYKISRYKSFAHKFAETSHYLIASNMPLKEKKSLVAMLRNVTVDKIKKENMPDEAKGFILCYVAGVWRDRLRDFKS